VVRLGHFVTTTGGFVRSCAARHSSNPSRLRIGRHLARQKVDVARDTCANVCGTTLRHDLDHALTRAAIETVWAGLFVQGNTSRMAVCPSSGME
jgi:hypothetical protein